MSQGQLTVGTADDGKHVVLRIPLPKKGGDVLFTPKQARELARLLVEKANQVEGQ